MLFSVQMALEEPRHPVLMQLTFAAENAEQERASVLHLDA